MTITTHILFGLKESLSASILKSSWVFQPAAVIFLIFSQQEWVAPVAAGYGRRRRQQSESRQLQTDTHTMNYTTDVSHSMLLLSDERLLMGTGDVLLLQHARLNWRRTKTAYTSKAHATAQNIAVTPTIAWSKRWDTKIISTSSCTNMRLSLLLLPLND